MKASNVTFGRVVAVTGNPKKMDKINKKLMPHAQNGVVMIKDVTYLYKNAPSNGELAQAAQRGELVNLYVTGDDINKIKEKQSGWKYIKDIMAHIQDCFSINPLFISESVDKILGRK